MANELIEFELPTGEVIDFEVPAGLTDQQVNELAAENGLFDSAPDVAPDKGVARPVIPDAPDFNEQDKPETAPQPTFAQRFVRQQELGLRAIAKGNPVTMANDILGTAMNAIPGVDIPNAREAIDSKLTDIGLAAPKTEGERVAGSAVEFGAGTVGGFGIAKMLPQLMAETLLTGVGTQVGASVAAGTAVGMAAEAGVGPWGQLLVGLLGGVGGGVATHSVLRTDKAIQLGTWADKRLESGKALTPKELKVETKANGLDMSSKELDELSDAMNQMSNAAKVEAATIDILYSPKTALSVTDKAKGGKRVLSKEEKDIRRDIRKTFELEADDADMYRRIALEQDAVREARKLAVETEGIERVRTREAMEKRMPTPRTPISQQVDAVRMKALTDRQNAAMAQLEQQSVDAANPSIVAVREAGDVRRAANEADDILRGNKETIRNKQGLIRATQTFGQKLIKRVHQISPRAAMGMRQVETTAARRTADDLNSMKKWLTDPKITKAFKKNGEFRRAVSNMDRVAMDRIVPGSSQVLQDEVVPVLERMGMVRQQNGLSVLNDMYPRIVKSVKQVRKAMGREQLSKLDELTRAKEKELGRVLNEDETAGIIGQLIGGIPMKQDKSRRILNVNKEAERHYVNPRTALIDSIHQFNKAEAKQGFFKNVLGEDLKLYNNLDEGKIGQVLQRSMDAGELSSADVHEMASLVSTYYGPGQRGASAGIRRIKDAVNISSIGFNPYATMTQLGDLFINAARFGSEAFTQLLPGRAGRVAADAYNAGVRELSSEMRTPTGTARVVRRGLRQFGFDQLDKKFSGTGTKAAYRTRQKQVERNPVQAQRELDELFGREGAVEVMDVLKNNEMSDRVAALIANDVADIRPQGGLDLPVSYSKSPNGRLAYSLLSWSINQMNFVRNNALAVIERGVQTNDMKMIGKGTKSLALMTALFAAGGGSIGVVKDGVKTMISGEPFDPVNSFAKHAQYGAVPMALSGKFLMEGLASGRKGVLDIIPSLSMINQAASAGVKFLQTGELGSLMNASTLTRNIRNLAIGAGIVSDAKASTHGVNERPAQLGRREQAQVEAELRDVRGETQLPEGTLELKPGLTGTDIDRMRAQANTIREIGVEQAAENEAPEPVQVAENMDTKTRSSIQRHEGKGSKQAGPGVSYNDLKGFRTIGYGILMEAKGKNGKGNDKWLPGVKEEIEAFGLDAKEVWDGEVALNDDQMDSMFEKHYAKAQRRAKQVVSNYNELPEEAQSIITEMVFQMGRKGVLKFKKMRQALRNEDYLGAYTEMLDSKWAREDSPRRAKELALRMLDLEVDV